MPIPVPTRLPANQPPQFYRGGSAIARLRAAGIGPDHVAQGRSPVGRAPQEWGPEDWVASTTTMFGQDSHGLSVLPDNRVLREAVRHDPVGWLGAEHVETFGSDTALLVKLLHAGQRLPVHCHPDDTFAQRHFSSGCGKTEAWLVIGTDGETGTVYLGFREEQPAETVAAWVTEQDGAAMLDALNAIEVSPGDTVLVPAGVPHAIGAGVFVVELQQPTDLSITLEWQGFLADPERAHLGIGYRVALEALDRSRWDPLRLSGLRRARPPVSSDDSIPPEDAAPLGQRIPALVPAADPFFRAEWVRAGCAESGAPVLDPSFGVLVVLTGQAELRPERADRLSISAGDTIVVPHAAGEIGITGELTGVYCTPPRATRTR